MSFMYKINSSGPRIEPWVTPLVTSSHEELLPSKTTRCCLFVRYEFSHFNRFPYMSKLCNFLISRSRGTLSNAFSKSKYTISTCFPLMTDFWISCSTCSNWVTIERPFINKCCRVYIWSCNNGYILLKIQRSATLLATDNNEIGF